MHYLLGDFMDLARQIDKGRRVELLLAKLDQGDSAEDRVLDRLEEGPRGVVQTRVCDEVQGVIDGRFGHFVLLVVGF